MTRRWIGTLVTPHADADAAWRLVRAQIRRIGRLTNAHRRDQEQIVFLKAELARVISERAEANVEIERLKAELTAVRRAQDLAERRAAHDRLVWVSRQPKIRRVKENTSG
jgi:regulator of replication initiation timing